MDAVASDGLGQRETRVHTAEFDDTQRVVGERYRLLAVIGRGGMSIVYLALDTVLNKQWAAKEIKHVENPAERELIIQSIVTEANMIKRFDHPAIPRIVDIVDDEGTLFVIMDYVEGRTLEDIVAASGPQAEDDVVDWALQLCDALSYLHHRTPPVIYRDMKPSNVMLKPNGLVELIDFGIAREMHEDGANVTAARSDTVQLGTRGFAPPEQYGGGGQTDARSDVYALGATMYALLTAKNPADPPYTILPVRQVVPELSPGIERIVARATQPDPADRYADCAEMAYDLEHYRENDAAHMAELKRKWNLFAGLGIAACLCLVLGIGGTVGKAVATNGDYDHWMSIGEQSSDEQESTEAYVRAAAIKPNEVEPYRGLIERYRDDLRFTPTEERQFRSTILPNISVLEGSDEYAELAFEVGKLYWYYYDPSGTATAQTTEGARGERIRAAESWMQQAATDSTFEQRDLAQTYADIASFNAEIVPLINEGSDAGCFEPYSDMLCELAEANADEENDVVRLETANLIMNAVRTYPRKFRADGVSRDELNALIDEAIVLAEPVVPTTEELEAERARVLDAEDAARQAVADAFVDARTVSE